MKSKTKEEKEHLAKVAALGCIICKKPAQVHHITGAGMGKKASHFETIPLCFNHHSAQTPLPYGHAVHKGTKTFEKNFGTQKELLEKTLNLLKKDIAT